MEAGESKINVPANLIPGSDAGRDWAQEEKGTTEDEMAGWHHWLDGHESEWTPGVGERQGGLACCDSWGHKESDTTERLIWSDLRTPFMVCRWIPLCYVLTNQGDREEENFPVFLFIKTLIPSWGLYSYDLITSQKPLLQMSSHWGLGFQCRNLRVIQSIALKQLKFINL